MAVDQEEKDYTVIVNEAGRIDAVPNEVWDPGDGVSGLRYNNKFRRATPDEEARYEKYIESTTPAALAAQQGAEVKDVRDSIPTLAAADPRAGGMPGWIGGEQDPNTASTSTDVPEADDDDEDEEMEDVATDQPVAPAPVQSYRTKDNKPGRR